MLREVLPYSFDIQPRTKEPTRDQTQQANVGALSNIRCVAKHPGPAATASQAVGPECQEEMAGEISDHKHAGQRTCGHTLSIGQVEQSRSDLRRSVSHPSAVRAQHISEGSTGQSYDTSSTLVQQFAHLLHLPCELPHPPTDTEKIRARARIAKREVQINALETKIRDLKATFEAESQEKYAAVMDHVNSRILAIQKEIADRMNDVLR